MATINEIVSKELRVPALRPGELVKFRLLRKGQLDELSKEPLILADYWQAGKEPIYDGFKEGGKGNKNVLILNATGIRHVPNPDGTIREEPIVEMVKWDSTGEQVLNEEQFETICFLRRSNKNKSNPFRNKRRKPLFFEVSDKAILNTKLFDEQMDINARVWVMDAKIDELKAIAMNLGMQVDNSNLDSLRISLLEKVKKDPKIVMIASSNVKMKKKIQVMDAEIYGILLWDEVSRDYYFSDDLKTSICNISRDVNKLDGILAFFVTPEGKGIYLKLAKKVAKLYEATIN